MRRKPPATEEGWYVLHDMRHIDWDAWRDASARDQERALDDGRSLLTGYETDEGQTAVYTVQGHKADLLLVHLRPTMADIDVTERQFEQTQFAQFTERASSYVSVTEASGYTERAREYFDGDVADDSGLAKYIQGRLHPDVPDDEFVCFYPMSKRRVPDQNWYELPFDERAEHITRHGDIGRQYGGKVKQMIVGSMGLDDWEWGVTLWTDDLTHVKDLLTEMRFDRSTSSFAEFGSFYVGRRFPPADLPAVLAGDHVPTDGGATASDSAGSASEHSSTTSSPAVGGHTTRPGTTDNSPNSGRQPRTADTHAAGGTENEDGTGNTHSSSGRPERSDEFEEVDDLPRRLGTLGISEGEAYDAGDYGLVFHSDADARDLAESVTGLCENFDHYDRHVMTGVRAQGGQAAVVSIWTAKDAAETASGFLGDLAGIRERYGGRLGDGDVTTGGGSDGHTSDDPTNAIRDRLANSGVFAGQPHGEDVFALVLYSESDPAALAAEVDGLRERFERSETHDKTAVYEDRGDTHAVVSLWDTQDAADSASESLVELPGIVARPENEDGFGTMGMFYTVEPDHREAFVETFEEVGGLLADMDGHRETTLLANREDENDMFIASQWDAKEDAMAFFRSETFAETVQWGRDVLAERPRHVFLA